MIVFLCGSKDPRLRLLQADECMDEGHRMAYIVAFAISRYSHNTRTTKPLNPVLGIVEISMKILN